MDGRHCSTSSYWFYGTGCWKEAMKVKSSAFPRNAWYFTKTLYPINSPPRDYTQFNHPNHPLMPTSTYPPSRKTNFTRYNWKLLQAAAFVLVSYSPEIQHNMEPWALPTWKRINIYTNHQFLGIQPLVDSGMYHLHLEWMNQDHWMRTPNKDSTVAMMEVQILVDIKCLLFEMIDDWNHFATYPVFLNTAQCKIWILVLVKTLGGCIFGTWKTTQTPRCSSLLRILAWFG